ncbi:YvrJ protein family [Urinicoccus massiliensis]|uniref:YvrJ protein family n=1 Tax=Urinicoccus massiliensis TaxID=1723382 RepID=A0A8H2QX67_9FIRM|nr:YvrJ family protein [Urinicoccus massiliensis]VFB15762.1 YvrJ protein family [Urinicoccus massiliensis]
MEDILSSIANMGFPIVVASFMLLRMESKMEELNETLARLMAAIEQLK